MLRFGSVIIIYLSFVEIIHSSHPINSEEDCYYNGPTPMRVFLTVSSLPASATAKGVVRRRLEVNWVGIRPARTDRIHIYRRDPTRNPAAKPILSVNPTKYPGGYYKSDIELPIHTRHLRVAAKSPCLGYWATYERKKGTKVFNFKSKGNRDPGLPQFSSRLSQRRHPPETAEPHRFRARALPRSLHRRV
ncbi:unnamed protein product [Larinioides sclopetarius]|uniref:Uncharacterized protein n=1 Tax=Larinioides sclopetarius TaxID=280406 RepID=A0AAV2B6Q0_9ARAC